MTSIPEPTVHPVAYQVSCLSEKDNPLDYDIFSIKVEYRGRDLWAVCWHSQCLSRAGEWDYEPISSSRDDDWLNEHRFDLDTALRLAKQQAPLVKVRGRTVAAVIERQRTDEDGES